MRITEAIKFEGRNLTEIFNIECVDGIVKDDDKNFPVVMLKDKYVEGARNVLLPGRWLCKCSHGKWIIYSEGEYRAVTAKTDRPSAT